MNQQNDNTILQCGAGIVECRICGLKFLPELEEDREHHEHEHRRILAGGLPYDIREFIKKAGWAAAKCEDGVQGDAARRAQEIAKRAVVFSYWSRAIANGIPENDLEAYMAAHFAFVDATVAGDEVQVAEANDAISRWYKYG